MPAKVTAPTKTALAAKNTTSATRAAAQMADRRAVVAKVAAKPVVKAPTKVAQKPIKITDPGDIPPVKVESPVYTEPVTAPDAPAWSLEGDPVYQQALASGQAQFNYARNAALAEKQNTETAKAQERKNLDVGATESRRRLAGNYASRGLAGGAAGALTMAEARANAEQIAARTSIQDQLAAVNQNYLSNFGAAGTDWTGTLVGQQYKTQAAQAAITNRLAQYGVQ